MRPLSVICSGLVFSLLLSSCAADAAQIRALDIQPDPPHPGDIVRVSGLMPFGAHGVAKNIEIEFRGTVYRGVEIGGMFLCLVGIDLGVEPGPTDMEIRAGDESVILPFEVKPKDFGSESLKVSSSYTNLSKEDLERVGREKTELTKIWKSVTPAKLWSKSFVKPTVGEKGSPFGLKRLFNGQPRSPHSGVDIKASTGTLVVASNQGRVVVADDLFFTGNTVVIDHGLGLYTIYAHLSELAIEKGDSVARSAEIGRVGATGRVTGPHLHWAAKLMGARVDPEGLPGRTRPTTAPGATAGRSPAPGP